MASGRTFGAKIDDALSTLSRELSNLSAKYDDLQRRKVEISNTVKEHVNKIAKTQLEAIGNGELSTMDSLSMQMSSLMKKREATKAALAREVHDLEQELKVLTAAADRAHTQREEEESSAAGFRQRVLDHLAGNTEHQELRKAAEEAEARYQEAKRKADEAERERASKGEAYEQDPVFSYLHGRGFGTAAYRANSLVRTVDGWLAQLCNYSTANRDYDALTALPSYLAAHADGMRSQLEPAVARLHGNESATLEAAGFHEMTATVEKARGMAEEASTKVDLAQAEINDRRKAISKINQWRDEAGKEMLTRMTSAFGGEALDRLKKRVQSTKSTEDDELLSQIQSLRDELEQVGEEAIQLSYELQIKKTRKNELDKVRGRYRAKGYYDSDYTVRGSSTGDLLAGFLLGSIASDDLWRGIERNTSWDPPASASSSSSSSSSSSPFSSGGGFGGGGGGFSTGGGF